MDDAHLKSLAIYKPAVYLAGEPTLGPGYPEAFPLLDSLQASEYFEVAGSEAEQIFEAAGRECYDSFHRPSEATDTTRKYIKSILDKEHYSVIEHGTFTFRFTGVSRSLTHELVRHRHMGFSQRSTRYVDESQALCVVPPLAIGTPAELSVLRSFLAARNSYVDIVQSAAFANMPRKKVREMARAVLPHCTETRLVVSANLRTWREFIQKRNKFADAEIHRLALAILEVLHGRVPSVMSDLMNPGES